MGKRIIQIDILRAFAIIAVIIIHTISASISPFLNSYPQIYILLGLDQLMRFSVPFFFAVSGYLLASKYQDKKLETRTFLKRRALRLLPPYFAWSAIIYVYLNFFSQEPKNPHNLFELIFMGRTDYHLYFVPALFYLYLLFPLIIHFYRRSKLTVLTTALVLQLGVIVFTNLVTSQTIKLPFLWGDQQQYVFPLSWIFYFVLGIYHASEMPKFGKVFAAALCFSAVILTADTILTFSQTQNYIASTTFTRFPAVLFAASAITSFIVFKNQLLKLPARLQSLFSKIGQKSYSIYLFHTLIIRLVWEIYPVKTLLSFLIFTLFVIYFTFITSAILNRLNRLTKSLPPASNSRSH